MMSLSMAWLGGVATARRLRRLLLGGSLPHHLLHRDKLSLVDLHALNYLRVDDLGELAYDLMVEGDA